MSHAQELPSISELEQLATLVSIYPVNAQKFVDTAKQYGFSKDILSFLRLFRPNEIFKDNLEFIARCEEMEILIQQKRESPREALRSSED